MYEGEVEIKLSDLTCLMKAAECLRIKGLAIRDEDPTANGSSINQQKAFNSSAKNDFISENVKKMERSDRSPSPPKKKQRNESVVEKNNLSSKVEVPTSVHSQQSSSSSEIKPHEKSEAGKPVEQIKTETDIQNEGCENVAGSKNDGMDYSNKNERVEIEKEEIDVSDDDDWTDFMGSYRSQKVSKKFCI